ncbi:MAG: nucleoside hydrolase [Bacteroidales bacterium]
MKNLLNVSIVLFFLISFSFCKSVGNDQNSKSKDSLQLIEVIFDTDANNEVDDQHALAYLILNDTTFHIVGVTVNATKSGGSIEKHYQEADRVIRLCSKKGKFPLYKGANGSFDSITPSLSNPGFDGHEAVDFIISEARKDRKNKLVLIPVGKLTNIALAMKKAPEIARNIRIVWLGSNYPKPGEYNQDNDIPALNYILDQPVDFEMVTVRFDDTTGSAAVTVTPDIMKTNMPGAGPLGETIEGRHGGSFNHFGDYSLDLFNHAEMYGNPPSRSLFDVVAVAVVKNPSWGKKTILPSPHFDLKAGKWVERKENPNKLVVWEYFDKQAILNDFFEVIKAGK